MFTDRTFRIVTGTIYGSDAEESQANKSNGSAALYRNNNGTAQYGTYSGSQWNNNEDLDTTDNTIRVLNGMLRQ